MLLKLQTFEKGAVNVHPMLRLPYLGIMVHYGSGVQNICLAMRKRTLLHAWHFSHSDATPRILLPKHEHNLVEGTFKTC